MYRILEFNTVAFLIQVAVYGIVYKVTGNVDFAITFAAIATFSIAFFGGIIMGVFEYSEFCVLLSATFTAFAITIHDPLGKYITVSLALAAVVVASAKSKQNDGFWPMAFCAFPAGVGTLIGCFIILYRKLTAFNDAS